jgi:(4S)-4-hydroxy-5-phosphonooxypentane-2,3-dione isomerase
MYVVCVTVHVVPEQVQPFLQATLENARQSRLTEPGNVRFDVLQAEADPNQFLLYEVYRAAEDFVRHQQTAHYLRWKETVAPWMAVPRQGVRHQSLFPEDRGWP